MATIWKYPLEVTDTQVIKMPYYGKVLCVQVQDDTPCLWIAVDEGAPQEERTFRIYGTGHHILGAVRDLNYLGTFQLMEGAFVGHLFEEVK